MMIDHISQSTHMERYVQSAVVKEDLVSQVEALRVCGHGYLVSQVEALRVVSQVEVLLVSQVEVLLVFAMVLLLKRHAASPSASARTLPAKVSEPPAEICDCQCGGYPQASEIPAQLCDGSYPQASHQPTASLAHP